MIVRNANYSYFSVFLLLTTVEAMRHDRRPAEDRSYRKESTESLERNRSQTYRLRRSRRAPPCQPTPLSAPAVVHSGSTTTSAPHNSDAYQADGDEAMYVNGEEACRQFSNATRTRLICNAYQTGRECVCQGGTYPGNSTSPLPYCNEQGALPSYGEPSDHLMTIGIGFPVPLAFARHPDAVLAESLQRFACIDRRTIVVYGMRCDRKRRSFELQFGIVHESDRRRLRTLSPEIFTYNPEFMDQPALHIKYIESSDRQLPIRRPNDEQSSAPQRKPRVKRRRSRHSP